MGPRGNQEEQRVVVLTVPPPPWDTGEVPGLAMKGCDVKLTHIAITNWRNFAHIEFDLSSRLFIVGPNSSGKTNLLAALRFLSDIAWFGLAAASENWGGPERYFRSGAEKVSFKLTFEFDEHQIQYMVSLRKESCASDRHKRDTVASDALVYPIGNRALVDSEDFMIDGQPVPITAEITTETDSLLLGECVKSFLDPGSVVQPAFGHEVRDTLFYIEHQLVRIAMESIRYIHPNPKKMLERSDRYDPDHGTGFFQHAGRFSDQQLDAVVDRIRPIMASVVPEIPNLSYQRMGLGTEVVFYSDTPVRGASGVYSHEQFSEGTLRLLGILFDLATLPRDTSVVLIEEPETFLQASVVRSLPSLLAEVAMNRDVQMVISTHSPELIDSELVLPSQVLMLRSENGETTGELLSESNDPRIKAVVSAGLPKSQGIDAVNGRTIPLGTW